METGLAGFEVDLLAGACYHPFLQVHHSVFPEAADRLAGVGVQRHQAVTGSYEYHAIVALAVGPIRKPPPRELPRCDGRALAFAQTVDPHQLSGLRVQGNYRSARARGGEEDALHHDGRAFQLVFRPRSQVVGLEAPGYFELVEVGRTDLI